jgi:hypothetical protein
MAQQKNQVFLVAQNMAQQKNQVVFGGTENGTAEKPGGFWWQRTWHSRKFRSFFMAKNTAQQKNPVVFGGTEQG